MPVNEYKHRKKDFDPRWITMFDVPKKKFKIFGKITTHHAWLLKEQARFEKNTGKSLKIFTNKLGRETLMYENHEDIPEKVREVLWTLQIE